nr:hypothetical protein Iba_chr09bCG14540 [Ipomoea batatas]
MMASQVVSLFLEMHLIRLLEANVFIGLANEWGTNQGIAKFHGRGTTGEQLGSHRENILEVNILEGITTWKPTAWKGEQLGSQQLGRENSLEGRTLSF